MISTINREAGDKAKGPRLQRLRCVLRVLSVIEKSEKPYFYAAVEHKDDVFLKNILESSDYLEQDKNFDSETSFTFNSNEILNTLVGFCDLWIEYGVKSKEVYLSFYCTNNVGKENSTATIKALGLGLPDKPMLELIQTNDYDYPNFLETAKQLILKEYRQQYQSRKDKGNLDILEGYSDEDWKTFLKKIDWSFGEMDEVALQKQVLGEIRKCKFFSHLCLDNKYLILSALMDLLDEKQTQTDLLAKFTSTADIELIFRNVASEQVRLQDDPVYKIWDQLPPPIDKRTILDKVKDVCNGVSPALLGNIARKASAGRIVHNEKNSDKSFLSVRYRIYDQCLEDLDVYLKQVDKSKWASEEQVSQLLAHLQTCVETHVNTIGKEFNYSLKSKPVIEGIILELFDSCYLSMDIA